jgi:hypothetical protein
MSRIRTIKPEFWADEKLATVSRDARLLFIGLWNVADDYGRLRGSPQYLRGQLFPYDADIDVEAALSALAGIGCIERYKDNGQEYVEVSNFSKHQKIDLRRKSFVPEPNNRRQTIEMQAPSGGDAGAEDPNKVCRKGREGKGNGREKESNGSLPLEDNEPTQEFDVPKSLSAKADRSKPSDSRLTPLSKALVESFEEIKTFKYKHGGAKDTQALKSLLPLATDDEIRQRWRLGLRATGWHNVSTFAQLAQKWNDLAAIVPPKVKPHVPLPDFVPSNPPPAPWKARDPEDDEEVPF